jgi:hypothetical protein
MVIGIFIDICAFLLGLGMKGVFKHANVGHVLACFAAVLAGECSKLLPKERFLHTPMYRGHLTRVGVPMP